MPNESTEYACSIASGAVPAAHTPQQVEQAFAKDSTLQLVRQAVASGDWSCLSGTVYKALAEELWGPWPACPQRQSYYRVRKPLEACCCTRT